MKNQRSQKIIAFTEEEKSDLAEVIEKNKWLLPFMETSAKVIEVIFAFHFIVGGIIYLFLNEYVSIDILLRYSFIILNVLTSVSFFAILIYTAMFNKKIILLFFKRRFNYGRH